MYIIKQYYMKDVNKLYSIYNIIYEYILHYNIQI